MPEDGLLTASHDGELRIQGPENVERPVVLEEGSGALDGCAITPSGTHALTIARNGTAKLWDLASRRCVRTLEGFASALLSCALTPDGRRAVLGLENGQIEVRDLRHGVALRSIRAHEGRVFGCAVTPEGTRLISVSEDKTVKVWSLDTGGCLGTLHGTSWFRCVSVTDSLICAGDEEGNLWMITLGTMTPSASAQRSGPSAPRMKQQRAAEGAPRPLRGGRPARIGSTRGDRASIGGSGIPGKLIEYGGSGGRASARDASDREGKSRLRSLRNVLARLYEPDRARILAEDAGLELQWISWSGTAVSVWHEVLSEADKRCLLRDLLLCALKDYPEDPELLVAARELGLA